MEEKTVQSVKSKKGMPRQTLAFIIFLIAVTILLVGLAVYTVQKPLSPTKPSNQVIFPSYAHTTLVLTPPSNTPGSPNTYTTNVEINTGGDKITAAQLELTFDPKFLTNVTITPESFIKNPVVLLKKVDQVNGRISLALGISLLPGTVVPSGNGILATITFNENPSATGSTILEFLPKTEVTAVGIPQSVLRTSTGSLFVVNQNPTPIPFVNTGTSSAK